MSLPFGIVDIGLAAAKPEETPENGECAFHAIATWMSRTSTLATYLELMVLELLEA
ncbi:hypothetical protein CHLRE_02g095153v5 [Chlamydomonas reinhardtii]|uniref:Uncharacterized protein n=1 Tax=Chlamydomonas reinhardtii TaxID=3055 RepID=A0A2K3E1S7_CHLRE|nr:uncharacterized protein CHLRE_02g095153v5 [Chlamydomonas reinhardtii]PNW86770.1 hypothetical protein CHLRE_02g095153v5 [Chlamydomonas reinhardtii]